MIYLFDGKLYDMDMSSNEYVCPQGVASDLDSSNEGEGILCVTSSYSTSAVKMRKGILNQMT